MNDGFLPLARRFFLHEFWQEKRCFSRAEAWMDLVQSASWQAGKRVVKGKIISLARGEQVAALRYLAARWDWSPMKVDRFLTSLENETMTRRETRQGETVVILCNFALYNNEQKENETIIIPETRQTRDNDETMTRQSKERKEGKEGKQRKNQSLPDPRFAAVTAGYCEKYKEHFGDEYHHQGGKDGTALSALLKGIKPEVAAETIVDYMGKAMAHRGNPFSTFCKRAGTIHGFCKNWNDIRGEISTARQQLSGGSGSNGHVRFDAVGRAIHD